MPQATRCRPIPGRILTVLLLLVLAGGCTTLGPNFTKPEVRVEKDWLETGDSHIKTETPEYRDWWTAFNDPVLDTLIRKAYEQNLSLQIAGIRILEARAQLGIATGFQYPQTQQVQGDYGFNQLSKNQVGSTGSRYYQETGVSFDAIWELDFWGKFRRAIESADATLIASVANYDDILVSLTAEVAANYVLLRTFDERLAVARANVKIQQRSLKISRIQFQNGAVTELDVQQAKTLLRNTQSTIPVLQAGRRQAENAISILLGMPPRDLQEILGDKQIIPTAPQEVAVGIPANLLRRRPDIRRAELEAAAQSARIGVALSDLYPRLSLFGSLGFKSSNSSFTGAGGSSIGDIFSWDSLTLFAGPALDWPILNYGRIKNSVRSEDARLQALLVNYQNAVLQAAREVEDALIGFLQAREQVKFLKDSVKAAKRSVQLALIQYRDGLVDYTRVLNTQQSLVLQQDQLTSAEGSVAQNLVALYKALGGGWELRVGKPFVSPANLKEMQERTDWGKLLNPDDLPQKLDPPAGADDRKGLQQPDW